MPESFLDEDGNTIELQDRGPTDWWVVSDWWGVLSMFWNEESARDYIESGDAQEDINTKKRLYESLG